MPNLLEYKGMLALEWMLSIKRKYNTVGEKALCTQLALIPGVEIDSFGNHMLRLGDDGNIMTIEESKKKQTTILFSAHTDTVHWVSGKQKIYKDEEKCEYFTKAKSGCLGADDAAGIWLLLELIKNKTPGLYIFHRGEECGGLGSSFISETTPDLIEGIKYAIAFDRRGKTDIINNQSCGKCASEEFVTSFAKLLNMGHSKARGSFTDTANYAGIIPECTNVSVGYEHEHSVRETLHYAYLQLLADKLLKINWSKLVCKRKTDDFGVSTFTNYGYNYGASNYKRYTYLTIAQAKKLVKDDPDLAANLLRSKNVTEEDVDWEKEKAEINKIRESRNKEISDNKFKGW